MKKCIAIALLASSFFAGSGAFAQDIQLLPEGQTLISLSVTERVQTSQDVLHASLRVESQDKDAKSLQNRINASMQRAMATAKAVEGVKASTGYYSVYPYETQPQGGRSVQEWRGSQSIELESRDAQALLELTGEIQAMGFAMNNLSYNLSTEKADEIRDGLMETALGRAREKAVRAAKALGKKDVDIALVNVDANAAFPQPVMMMRSAGMEAAADMAAPVAEAGEAEVTLTVTVHAVAK